MLSLRCSKRITSDMCKNVTHPVLKTTSCFLDIKREMDLLAGIDSIENDNKDLQQVVFNLKNTLENERQSSRSLKQQLFR